MIIDTEMVNVAVRASLAGLIGVAFLMIKNLYSRFKKMESSSSRVDSNHDLIQEQLESMQVQQEQLQSTVNTIMELLLTGAVNERRKGSRNTLRKTRKSLIEENDNDSFS